MKDTICFIGLGNIGLGNMGLGIATNLRKAGFAIEALAEAFTLAQKHGVPRQKTHEFFSETMFDCFVYRGYGALIASEHYQPVGAPPSLIRKDLGLSSMRLNVNSFPCHWQA